MSSDRLIRTAKLAALAAAMLASASVATAVAAFDLSRHDIPTDQILSGGPPKDGIPALDDPRMIGADEASYLRSGDVVVGLEIEGDARAYPLRLLNWHEVVNDEVGEQPVAVTYCPLTGSAVVFDRRVGDRALSFGVSGRLYRSNVLMYDRRTESLWSQLAGAAVTGERTGDPLRTVPAVVITWARWRSEHPDTSVMSVSTGHARDYERDPYAGYATSPRQMFPTPDEDTRLPAKSRVLGLVSNGDARAYPRDAVMRAGGAITDTIGDREISIRLDHGGAAAFDDGKLVPSISLYWFAWSAFHPDTSVWTAPAPGDPEPESTPIAVTVTEVRSYWTSLGAVTGTDPSVGGLEGSGMFVVAGTIRNDSAAPVHHVRLRISLLDGAGSEVHYEEAFNRSAEALRDLDAGPLDDLADVASIRPIAPGESDTYRMIFLADEVPRFDRPEVTVLATD